MKTFALLSLFALIAVLAFYATVPPLAEAASTEGGCPAMDFEVQAFRDFHTLVEELRSIRETLQTLVELEKTKGKFRAKEYEKQYGYQ